MDSKQKRFSQHETIGEIASLRVHLTQATFQALIATDDGLISIDDSTKIRNKSDRYDPIVLPFFDQRIHIEPNIERKTKPLCFRVELLYYQQIYYGCLFLIHKLLQIELDVNLLHILRYIHTTENLDVCFCMSLVMVLIVDFFIDRACPIQK